MLLALGNDEDAQHLCQKWGRGEHRDPYMYFLFFHRSSKGDQRNSLRKIGPVFLALKTEERAQERRKHPRASDTQDADCPLDLPEGGTPADSLILAWWGFEPTGPSDNKCVLLNFFVFMPLGWWHLVTASVKNESTRHDIDPAHIH